MRTTEALVEIGETFLYPNYRQPQLVLDHGSGCELFDLNGKRYLDMYAGIAVSTLGHNHPRLVRAINEQASKLLHLSNYYYNEPNLRLAQRLCQLTGMARAFFCNSGSEAVEAMLKLSRRYFFAQGQPERVRLLAFNDSFHGRTLGALSLTGQASYREGFGPLGPVTHLPYGDLEALQAALGPDVAGIIVEPVQGEGGVRPAPAGFLQGLREVATAQGILLLGDEIQTGLGRTGQFLGFQQAGVQPDAIALAKGLAGGVPIGSMLCQPFLAQALPPGSHGSTFGGSPLACAAAHAVLDVMAEQELLAAVRSKGQLLAAALAAVAAKHSCVETSRGLGLLQALVLDQHTAARTIADKVRERGVLLSVAGGCALRFTPPLIISAQELEAGVAVVDAVLTEHAEAT